MLRLVTAAQIERLHFWSLKETSRPVVRRRVLKRLSDAHALIALPRRIGGQQHGSEQQMFALDAAGAQLIEQRYEWKDPQPHSLLVPGALFHRHRLTVSELYVRLTEISRLSRGEFAIAEFQTEPACWWPFTRADARTDLARNSRPKGFLKPDAFIKAYLDASTEYGIIWVEVDLGTESISRVRDKVALYASFARDTSEPKPYNVMPDLFITTNTERRRDALRNAIRHVALWGQPLSEIVNVRVECFDDAALLIDDLPGPKRP